MKISRRERKYILPAVLYLWDIHSSGGGHVWDGDEYMKVSVGAICEKLIEKGILQRISYGSGHFMIRSTDIGLSFVCQSSGCLEGKLYDDNNAVTGECANCEGTGVLLQRLGE